MSFLITLFWTILAVLFYTYIGYGLLLILLQKAGAGRKPSPPDLQAPVEVTVIISAYLEDNILEEKIKNTLDLEYPVHIILIIDGETSHLALQNKYPGIQVILQPVRSGKYEAIKRAMQEVKTPLVIFSDANSMLNRGSVEKIVSHYNDSRIGAVAGEKKITEADSSAIGEAEGIYWKYESMMKRLDAGFYTVIGAAGELYSIRTALFIPLEKPVLLDDLVISMQVCLQGYRIAYEPSAFATEKVSGSLKDETARKLRIAAGAYQSVGYLKGALNIFRHPLLGFQYFSRRILRWIACPPLIPIFFIINALIVYFQPQPGFYLYFLLLQIFFYLLALAGWMLIRNGKKAGLLSIPFYFLFMNYCMLRGFARFFGKKQPVTWQKAER